MEETNNKRAGVGIGIITRGVVPTEWAFHMMQIQSQLVPVGMFWKWIRVDRKSWAPARQEVVELAKKEGLEWLFFIDDDVMINPDTLQRFLSYKKDIVTGIYWTKTENSVPVIFEKMGAGPMYNFPLDKLFEVDGSGLGVCLINMKVFDAFDKAGIPYFKENWIMETEDGKKLKCPIGEDHYFFYHAKKFGFKVWADGGALCDHYNVKNNKRYPDKETVRKLCAAAAEMHGESDIIMAQKKEMAKMNKTPKKNIGESSKKIAFLNLSPNLFAGDELDKRGVGGAETAIINVSRELAKNKQNDVSVFCGCPRPGIYDGVNYYNFSDNIQKLKDLSPDVLIVVRNATVFNKIDLKKEYNAKEVWLWVHDMPGDPVFNGFEQSYPFVDKIIALTEYHKKIIMRYYPFVDENKIIILPNGVNMEYFKTKQQRVPGRMIYSSTPYRGLEYVPELFQRIKKRVPYATMKIFSSMKVYGDEYKDTEFNELYDKIKATDGIDYVGTTIQKHLAQEYQKAELMLYPNIYPETSCIGVMESQAAGTPIVTSAYAALNETVPDDAGIKISGSPELEEYKKKFVDAAVELLTDKKLWTKMSNAAASKDNSWASIAKLWEAKIYNKKENDVDSIYQFGNINTPEYWDSVYNDELNKNIVRGDNILYEKLAELSGIPYMSVPKVLDVGCGTGAWTRYVKDHYPAAVVWGSDFSMKAIDYCRQRNRKIFYANHPLLNGKYEKNYFDVITMNHFLEHLDEPGKMIERAKELLKPNGRLLIVFPLNDNLWREHLKIWTREDVENFVKSFTNDYKMITRYTGRFYEDGREFEEAIVTMRF